MTGWSGKVLSHCNFGVFVYPFSLSLSGKTCLHSGTAAAEIHNLDQTPSDGITLDVTVSATGIIITSGKGRPWVQKDFFLKNQEMGAGVLDMKARLAKETTWIDIIIVNDDPRVHSLKTLISNWMWITLFSILCLIKEWANSCDNWQDGYFLQSWAQLQLQKGHAISNCL